jgi:hypothetical protein
MLNLASVIHEAVTLFGFCRAFDTVASRLGNHAAQRHCDHPFVRRAADSTVRHIWRLYSSSFPLMFQL